MKKIAILLFLLVSVFASAQIQIPQVTGLPAALSSKVDKVAGKSLVADTLVTKLNGMQSGAQRNVIEEVQKNGEAITIINKKVNVIVPTTPQEVGAEPVLGFTPEVAGVANSLITSLKDGVPETGNTLNKLFNIAESKISPKAVSITPPYTIGQSVEGGIVFYILQPEDLGYDATKKKYLIVSPSDFSQEVWSTTLNSIGGTSSLIGTGSDNTDIITNNLGLSGSAYAAKICKNLTLNGFSDWYLPSENEATKLFLSGISGLPTWLWTSTEVSSSSSILMYSIPESAPRQKNEQYPFRAIRMASVDLGYSLPTDGDIILASGNDAKEVKGGGVKLTDITDKLSGIQAGAQVNVLEGVQRNGVDLSISNKKVNVVVPTTPVEVGLGNVDNTSDLNKPVSTATQSALDLKENLLPATPSNPESKWLNGNKQWAEMVMGSGGYASNVYFTNLTSTIVGSYKQTSGTADASETIASATCNNNEVLIYTYLFEQPVGVTTVDAGVWRVTLNSAIDLSAGDSKFKFVQFRRSSAGVETDMFSAYSNTIENRVGSEGYMNNILETIQPSFVVSATDRLGCRVYATTTASGNRNLSYKVGDGSASYLNTPLALRHSQLRDKNGESAYQHMTANQATVVSNLTGINLNKIPKSTVGGYSNSLITDDGTTVSISGNLTASNLSGNNTGDQTTITGNAGTATKLQTARNINGVSFDGTQNITVNAVDATPRIASSLMGAANGVATLDATGVILTSQLPSYIDDVLEYANFASFPVTGEAGKIYVAKDNNKTYRWSGSIYVYITSGAVDSVNGYTGIVSLSKSDVGLGNADNTSDANKPISSATQTALNGKQPSGTYATGTGIANGTNTGDNAVNSLYSGLVSNATHTGDVTGSSVLTLATVNSNVGTYNNVTINAKGQATGGSNVGYLTSISSGQVTAALGYTPLPTRTFGTAANNNTGDFYAAGSTVVNSTNWGGNTYSGTGGDSNLNILMGYNNVTNNFTYYGSSSVKTWLGLGSNAYNSTAYLPLSGGSITGRINSSYAGNVFYAAANVVGPRYSANWSGSYSWGIGPHDNGNNVRIGITDGTTNNETWYAGSVDLYLGPSRKVWHSENLTNGLTNGCLTKWNGTTMVNSLISDDGGNIRVVPNSSGIYSNLRVGFLGNGLDILWNNNAANTTIQSYGASWDINISTGGGNLNLGNSSSIIKSNGKLLVESTEQSDMDGTTINSGAIQTNGGISAVKDINSGASINAYGDLVAYGTVRVAGGTPTQLMTRDGGYVESSSVGGASGNGSLTVVGSSNFGSAIVVSHTYSVIGSMVTESIDCTGTPSSSGVFSVDVTPQYESKVTAFTPTGTGTLNNGTIYPASAWIYKAPTSVVRLSSSNGVASTNNRITIMIQYEKQ